MRKYDFEKEIATCYYQDIDLDIYLKFLARLIEKIDIVNNLNIVESNKKISPNKIVNTLSFFDDLNIKLHEVYLKNNNFIIKCNPSCLPFEVREDILTSFIYNNYFKDENNNPNKYYKKIYLLKKNYKYVESSYIHEIVHTQMDGIYNYDDELNEELLSIYFELLYGYYNNYFERYLMRLKNLKDYTYILSESNDEVEIFKAKKYIKSILQAIKLYHLYIDSNNNIRNYINTYIQDIFNREDILENMLEYFDINYDNSKVDINTLKRYK